MTVQKLTQAPGRQDRWLAWLSDGTALRLGEGDVVRLSLYEGKELDGALERALREAAVRAELSEKAMDLLSVRPMSRRELLDKLTARPRRAAQEERDGEEELRAQAEAVAGRLEELGLLNDGEYARAVVRHYAAKGYGVRKLRYELYRRGVPRELWEEALAEAETDGEQLDRLLRHRLRGQELSRENLKRASDYLARRGFRWEEISQALDRLRAEAEEDWGESP